MATANPTNISLDGAVALIKDSTWMKVLDH